jgi:hypothetical protein
VTHFDLESMLVGKTISAVDWSPRPTLDGRHVPPEIRSITFTDGTVLNFRIVNKGYYHVIASFARYFRTPPQEP